MTCTPRVDGVTDPAAMDPGVSDPTAPIGEPGLPIHLRHLRPPHPEYLAYLLEYQERLARIRLWRHIELPDVQLNDELRPFDQDCLRPAPDVSLDRINAWQLALVFIAIPVAPLNEPPWINGTGAMPADPDYDPAKDYWVVAAAEGYDVGLRVTEPARFLQLNDDGSFLDLGRAVRLHHWPQHRAEITGRLYVQRLTGGEIRVTARMLQPAFPLAEPGLTGAMDAGPLAESTAPSSPARIIEPVDPAEIDGPEYSPRTPWNDCHPGDPQEIPCFNDPDPCCDTGGPCCGSSNPCCDGTGAGCCGTELCDPCADDPNPCCDGTGPLCCGTELCPTCPDGSDECNPDNPSSYDDGNACTEDSCDPKTGCSSHSGGPGGGCPGGSGNPCFSCSCDPETGPVLTCICGAFMVLTDDGWVVFDDPAELDGLALRGGIEPSPCCLPENNADDGDPCTDDSCSVDDKGEVVIEHEPKDCDDGNDCTFDRCDSSDDEDPCKNDCEDCCPEGEEETCETLRGEEPIEIVSVQWVEIPGTPLDANPNTGGGLRIFPDKDTPNDNVDHTKVKVRVQLNREAPDTEIKLVSFDVDDPYNGGEPLDDEGDEQDNRGEPEQGRLSTQTKKTTQSEPDFVEVEFTVTTQPGDNFRVVAKICPAGDLNRLRARQNDPDMNGTVVDNSDTPVPASRITPMLTVWRRLWVETDTMRRPSIGENTYTALWDNPRPGAAGNQVILRVDEQSVSGDNAERQFEFGLASPLPGVTGPIQEYNDGGFFSGYDEVVLQHLTTPDGQITGLQGLAGTMSGLLILADDDLSSEATYRDTIWTCDDFYAAPNAHLAPPDLSLLETRYHAAYIHPIHAVGVSSTGGVTIFLRNQGLESGQSGGDYGRALWDQAKAPGVRNLPVSQELYWTVMVVSAWQAEVDEDADPQGEPSTSGANTHGDGRTAAILQLGNTYTGICTVFAAVTRRPNETDNQNPEPSTVAHEIGHTFGLRHSDGGLMAASGPQRLNPFTDISLHRLRSYTMP